MKVDIIRKFKWYIVGFIMIVIMLSVGLSFCAWDNLSINKSLSTAKTGNYETVYKLGTQLGDDKGTIGKVDVGDIVTFGKYWQDTGATGAEGLKPQRWIVVNIDIKNVATLLAEKVVVYGNFWGLHQTPLTYYQNYYQSTLRAWLNSGRDSVTIEDNEWELGAVGSENLRDDTITNGIGSPFEGTAGQQANRGFLDVAFGVDEQSILVPKHISGIQGYDKDPAVGGVNPYTTRNKVSTSINDLVWIPSCSEIYGTNVTEWGETIEGESQVQFKYFQDKVSHTAPNKLLLVESTDYAHNSASDISSYYNNGKGGSNNSQTSAWWWLRSPYPSSYDRALTVNTAGMGWYATTCNSNGGVRPAVCVQL